MTKVDTFIDALIKAFKLDGWDIFVKYTNTSGNADVDINHRYNRIKIRIHKEFFEEELAYQAQTLIHEFCHLFNVPMYNLLQDSQNGILITPNHADDVLENINMRAEKVITGILTSNDLQKAYKEYVSPKKKLRSVKRGSKLRSKR